MHNVKMEFYVKLDVKFGFPMLKNLSLAVSAITFVIFCILELYFMYAYTRWRMAQRQLSAPKISDFICQFQVEGASRN